MTDVGWLNTKHRKHAKDTRNAESSAEESTRARAGPSCQTRALLIATGEVLQRPPRSESSRPKVCLKPRLSFDRRLGSL